MDYDISWEYVPQCFSFCLAFWSWNQNMLEKLGQYSWVGGWGLGAFLKWWPPSTMWAGPLIFLWPPPGVSEYSHIFKFGFMCYMLSTFQMSSRIVANISGPFLFLNSSWGLTGGKYFLEITIAFDLLFKILLFQVTFLIFFSIAILSPYFFWFVIAVCGSISVRELVKYLESL